MAINYTALQTTATNLITDFGQAVTFYKTSRGSYSPGSGFASHSSAGYATKVVLLDQPKAEATDTQIQEKRTQAIMSSSTAPEIGDTATINTEEYRIAEVEPIQPASTVVAYELLLAS